MGKVLNSPELAWRDSLLLRLRMRNVPGARIGEVLAEVQSHVAETGEDPREAFGSPKEYADRIADALGAAPSGGWRAAVRRLTWRDVVLAVATGLASFALFDGLWSLAEGRTSLFELPAWVVCVVGALVLATCTARFVVAARHEPDGDPVLDPRTGADMTPFTRRQIAVLAGLPVLFLGMAVVSGLLAR